MADRETPTLEERAGGVLMILVCFLALAQVLARYVLGQALGYSEELVRYLFVALTFLGLSGNIARRGHLAVHLFPDSERKRWLPRVQAVATAAFALVVMLAGLAAVAAQWRSGHTTPALEWPRWIVVAVVPVTMAAALVRALALIRRP